MIGGERVATSRRGFLCLTATVGGSAALASACGRDDSDTGAGTADISGGGDVQRLNAALDTEFTAVAAYTQATTVLEAPVLALAQTFLGHEKAHAAKLTGLVRDLGGTPHRPKTAEEYSRGFPSMQSREDVLRFATRVEEDALRLYLENGPRLTDPVIRQTASAIATVQAEHLTVLLGALGEPPAPDAFVSGS